MAGVPAGRLSIEIVADIARLQTDLDKAKRAVSAASRDLAGSARAANDNIARMGGSSRLASHHMSNLSFQIQDIIIGLKGGQKPMTVFMQQGSQISQIMMQAGVGIGGMVKAVASMVFNFARAHPILLAITAAAGAIAGAFGMMAGEINKNSKVTVTWGDVALGTFDAIRALLVDKLGPAFEWLSGIAGQAWAFIADAARKSINFLIGAGVTGVNTIIAAWQTFPGALAELFVNGVNAAIMAMERLINTGIAGINRFVSAVNDAVGSNISTIGQVSLGRLEQNYAGAGATAGRALAEAATGSFRDYIGEFVEYVSPFAQARARARIAKDAEEAGKAAGSKAGKAAAKEMGLSFADAFSGLSDYFKQTQAIAKVNEKLRETLAGLQREAMAIGLSAKERKALIRALEYEAQIRPLLLELATAEIRGQEELAVRLREQIKLRKEILAQEIANEAREAGWERMKEAVSRVNDQLRDMAYLIGGPLGGFMEGLLNGGNFSGLGAPGQLLNILLTPQNKLAEQVDVLAKGLNDIFGIGGSFGKTLAGAMRDAAVGSVAGRAIFGSSDSGVGSGLGGALGGAVGSIFGPLGQMAGSILGGIAGGFIESLFGGADKGVIGITGSSSGFSTFSTKHGSAEQLAAATQAATGMFDALGNIAQQLGGTLNAGAAGRLSLGMRDDDWVLDPTGQGRTKGAGVINFGPDQEAAVKAAMKLLIDRGVIGGIRESTQRLLSNASDLEQGLQDALAFEGVFKALEAQANPFASALRQLGQEMEYLEGVFQRAGATAEEYAQLQQFIAMQQQALIDQASANYRSTFYSDAENVAFAKQTISSTLTPLGYGNVDTVAEYRALVEATDALANPELYGTLMELSDEFGVLKDAADRAAAAAEAEAAAKKAEAAARKAAAEAARDAAENALRQAYQRERNELEQTADTYRRLAEGLRDWRKELMASSNATLGYEQRLADLRRTFNMARLGDEKALGALSGAGTEFLSAARTRASTEIEYLRDVAMVANMAEQAARGADNMASEAERQIAKLDEVVGKLIDINEGVLSVADAIKALQGGAGAGGAKPAVDRQQRDLERIQRLMGLGRNSRAIERMIERYEAQYGPLDRSALPEAPANSRNRRDRDEVAEAVDRMSERLSNIEANTAQTAVSSNKTARKLDGWDFQGRLLTTTDEAA